MAAATTPRRARAAATTAASPPARARKPPQRRARTSPPTWTTKSRSKAGLARGRGLGDGAGVREASGVRAGLHRDVQPGDLRGDARLKVQGVGREGAFAGDRDGRAVAGRAGAVQPDLAVAHVL